MIAVFGRLEAALPGTSLLLAYRPLIAGPEVPLAWITNAPRPVAVLMVKRLQLQWSADAKALERVRWGLAPAVTSAEQQLVQANTPSAFASAYHTAQAALPDTGLLLVIEPVPPPTVPQRLAWIANAHDLMLQRTLGDLLAGMAKFPAASWVLRQ